MNTLTLSSPAKINLHLRVAPPDGSGFHPLRSWMVRLHLVDTIHFQRREAGGITLACDDPNLPTDGTNLVCRAAELIAPNASVAIVLSKRIPAGAGLGGGSSNAATTLVGLNQLLGVRRSPAELHAMAATLGSDVPFFLGSPGAVATGRGERLAPAPSPTIARFALLVFPPFGISTAAAYRELDRLRPTAPTETISAFDVDTWSTLPAQRLMVHLVNDLETPAFAIEPRLASLRLELERRLARGVRMTGSGSTLFTLFDSLREAAASARPFESLDFRTICVEVGGADR